MKIDLETYSGYNIKITGLHKYVEHPDFKILLVSWSDESGGLHTWDCTAGLPLPQALIRDLMNPEIIKYAYNAKFEITCLQKYLPDMPVTCWRDDMFTALYNGLPASLGDAGKALGLPADKSKDLRGKALIRRFCGPAEPKPYEGPEWKEFIDYNRQDVTAEAAVVSGLPEPPEHEQRVWIMDMFINARGVKVDMQLVNNAIRLLDANTAALMAEARELSGLENPNSVKQLMGWFKSQGVNLKGLTKEIVSQQLAGPLPATVRRMFEIRQSLGRTSVKKYKSILDSVCADGRIRGLFQIYGAPRTGRFAGRRVQLQNLKRNAIDNIDEVRQAIKAGYVPDGLDVTDTLGQLIRTTLIPGQGKRFIVADYSAIEARVIAWAANEKWRLTSFAEGRDIYCESASAMFGVPVVKHGINGHLRQKGKIAELACGYGGSLGAMKAMGADKAGLSDDEITDIVTRWRDRSPHIVALWDTLERAAFHAIQHKGHKHGIQKCWFIFRDDGCLYMHLPSNREICYRKAHICKNRWGQPSIGYWGWQNNWVHLETYGGKLTENFVQAVSRDILVNAMLRLDERYNIVMHVHDEVIIEHDTDVLEDVIEVMTQGEDWTTGLPLDADGFMCDYYRKD